MLQLTIPAGFESLISEVGTTAAGPGLPPPSVPDIPRLAAAAARHGTAIVGPPLDLADFGLPLQ